MLYNYLIFNLLFINYININSRFQNNISQFVSCFMGNLFTKFKLIYIYNLLIKLQSENCVIILLLIVIEYIFIRTRSSSLEIK